MHERASDVDQVAKTRLLVAFDWIMDSGRNAALPQVLSKVFTVGNLDDKQVEDVLVTGSNSWKVEGQVLERIGVVCGDNSPPLVGLVQAQELSAQHRSLNLVKTGIRARRMTDGHIAPAVLARRGSDRRS